MQNKKIALFSCHFEPNYGSMLQAYALHAVIQKLGVDSEYLSYTTDPDPTTLKTRFRRFVKRILIKLGLYKDASSSEWFFLSTPEFSMIMEAFKRFHDTYIPCSINKYYADTVRRKLNINDYYNYIVGSDQTWSPVIYNPLLPYFLDFADIKKKNAYAPSLGTTVISSEFQNILKQKLYTFKNISCREKANADTLSAILGRHVQHVLDPTLLLQPLDWDKLSLPYNITTPYILAYILGEKDTVVEFAEALGKSKNLPVYYILTRPKYLDFNRLLDNVGPSEFIGLIRDAEYIVTDSFHGCLFSINYNKNFYAFSKQVGDIHHLDNIRIWEFLSQLGLENRFQNDGEAIILDNIDYSTVNRILDNLRSASLHYLSQIIF